MSADTPRATPPPPDPVLEVLRQSLIAHAVELGIDPGSIRSPRPRAVAATTVSGTEVLSIDYGTFGVSR